MLKTGLDKPTPVRGQPIHRGLPASRRLSALMQLAAPHQAPGDVVVCSAARRGSTRRADNDVDPLHCVHRMSFLCAKELPNLGRGR